MGQMTFHEFQNRALPLIAMPKNNLYPVVALGGETGELLNVRKKIERDEPERETGKIGPIAQLDLDFLDEAGDVLFYLRMSLLERGFALEDAAEACIEKLDLKRREKEMAG